MFVVAADIVASPLIDKDVLLAIITAVVSITTVVGSIFAAYFAYKANASSRANSVQLATTNEKVTKLEHNTDGIHKELLEQKGKASYLEGHEVARAEGDFKTAEVAEKLATAMGAAAAAATSGPSDPAPVASAIADAVKSAIAPPNGEHR